jgi:hypothetical protein
MNNGICITCKCIYHKWQTIDFHAYEGQNEIVMCWHDASAFAAYAGLCLRWLKEDDVVLHEKGNG